MTPPQLNSEVRCPACDHVERVEMPIDACVFFHQCVACGTVMRPKRGDCCVFCSYGSLPCPMMQQGVGGCCGDGA